MSEIETTEVWSVALAPDNIATMTLEELDAAFQDSQITEQTLVWTEGMDAWLPLGEVIGGADDEEATADLGAGEPVAETAAADAIEPLPGFAPVPNVASSGPESVRPGEVVAPPAFAPMQSAPSAVSVAPPPDAPSAPSTAPISMPMPDLDSDLDAFQPRKKSKLGLLAAAAVVLGGVGFTAMNLSGGSDQKASAAAAAPVVAPEGGQPLAVATKNDPNAPLELGGYQVSEKEREAIRKETEAAAAQKAKMAEALGGEATTEKPPAKTGKATMRKKYGAKRPSAGTKKSTGTISKGGNSFDPLNGSLP